MYKYPNAPILRMSLENVAKDFHMNIIESHKEVQNFIESNLDKMLQDFISKELPSLTEGIIRDACRKVVLQTVHEKFKSGTETEIIDMVNQHIVSKCDSMLKIMQEQETEDIDRLLETSKTLSLVKKMMKDFGFDG